MVEKEKTVLKSYEIKRLLKNSIFILSLIGVIGFLIRINFFSYEVPVSADALTYFMHAIDAKVLGGLPNTALANNGWPLFLSLFFGLIQSKNFFDYSSIQQILSILLSVATIIPVYLICKKFVKNEFALLGAGIFALEPRLIQNSVLGITEPFYIILGSISLLFFLTNRISYVCISFGFIAITSMVRAEGIFLLIPFSIMFFIKFKTEKILILKFLFVLSIFCLILTPMTIYKMDVREGDDAIFGRVTSSINDSSVIYKDNPNEFLESAEKSIFRFIQYIGWIQIPIFIMFVPIGLFLIFKNRTHNSWTLILSIVFMLIPIFYGISTGPDTRYLYSLYPIFCVLSAITIQRIMNNKENSLKFLVVIFVLVLGFSSIFLSTQIKDMGYEKDAMKVAQFLTNNDASGVNNYYPETRYISPALIESGEFPKLAKDYQLTKIEKFHIDSNTIEEFIINHRNEGLSHLVIDNKDNQVEFLKQIFDNEENYPYLIKELDSNESKMKYEVKIFKINFQEFDNTISIKGDMNSVDK